MLRFSLPPYRKWLAVYSIWIQDTLIYKGSMMVWVLSDVASAIVMPFIWIAASKSNHGPVAGYNIHQMVLYYMVMFSASMFIVSHIVWDVMVEIRDGLFTATLLRPMSIFQYFFFRNIAYRTLRPLFFLPLLIPILIMFWPVLHGSILHLNLEFWVSLVLGHLVSFSMVLFLAPIAFYTQEAQAVYELFYAPLWLLSGQLVPIEAMPIWVQKLTYVLPFFYTTGVPVEISVGKLQGTLAVHLMLGQLFWICFFAIAGTIFWKKGIRQYTGLGL